jgi:hypothetical protein
MLETPLVKACDELDDWIAELDSENMIVKKKLSVAAIEEA